MKNDWYPIDLLNLNQVIIQKLFYQIQFVYLTEKYI